MAQWPSYLTHEIHVKVWVWKRSDSIEQNRKTELTWIMQCHQADFRGVVPRCALVPPGTTYGITVVTTCSVMLTLPSFRIVPRASMITNAHNDCHQCCQFHCCNFQQLLCHCRTSQMRQLGDVDRTENRHGRTEQWSFLCVLQLRNSCCRFRKWSFPDMHVVACVVLVVSFPRIFEEIYSSMPSICSLGQKNHAIQPINNQVRGERQRQEQSEQWSWCARQNMTAATFLNSVI